MPKDRTLRAVLALARANGLPSEMASALAGTINQYSAAEASAEASEGGAARAAAQ